MMVNGKLDWYSPEHRGVLPLSRFHVSRRLQRVLRKGLFRTTVNQQFQSVITGCAARLGNTGNWIDQEIIDSYLRLHNAGFAHSIEVWHGNNLAGGLYGVSLRGAFFGESMFHNSTDASKVALCKLVDRLQHREYQLLDIQWLTSHLARFGAIEIPRQHYLGLLVNAMKSDCKFV